MTEPTFATVSDLVAAFETLHLTQLKDARPVRCKIRKYFGPLLPLPLESLTVPVILGWVNEIRKHSTCQADGCLTILRTMINRAIEWEMHKGANVAQLIKRKRSPRRKRYVLREEMPALVREIEREPLMNQVYFYLLLFVGPRPGEAEVMKRQHIKLFETDGALTGLWIKPETKNGEPHHVPLPHFVCALLKWYLTTLPSHQDYLFSVRPGRPASKGNWHLQWKDVRTRAGLLDVQLRDIRRTCATYLLNLQQSKMDLLTLSKGVMNHRDLNTTQIYAQPMIETIQRSMDQNVKDIRRHVTKEGGHGESSYVPEQSRADYRRTDALVVRAIEHPRPWRALHAQGQVCKEVLTKGGCHENTTVLEPVTVGVSHGAGVGPSDGPGPDHRP